MSTTELLVLLADLKALNQKLDRLIGMLTVMAQEITTHLSDIA